MSLDVVYLDPANSPKSDFSTAVDVHRQQDQLFNPAQAYVLTLSAGQSRNKVIRILNSIAQAFGYADLNVCPWHEMTYDRLLAYRTMQVEAGLAPASINLQLCTLRMVAKQAWLKRMMSQPCLFGHHASMAETDDVSRNILGYSGVEER